MVLLSVLKNSLSYVFSASQSDGEDADVEQTQATDGSAYSDVASSQTFQVIEGPPAVGGTDFAADVDGGLQNPNSNRAVAGQLNIAGNAEACPVTVTQLYDDEEWASNLSGEDIEAGTHRSSSGISSN